MRKILLSTLVLFVSFFTLSQPSAVMAKEYPEKPITMYIPLGTGDSSDIFIRTIAPYMEQFLGQSIILINQPGSGGAIAISSLAKAKPDGYTLSWANLPTLVTLPQMRKLTYDPKELVYVATPMQFEYVVYVNEESPYKSLSDLIEAARKNPNKVRYGVPGTGSTNHLGLAWLANKEDVKMIAVPFEGNPKAISALIGGHIDAVNTSVTASISSYQAKLIRPLAIFSDERVALLPEVKTLQDLGYDFSQYSNLGAVFPANTPENIRKRMEDAIKFAVSQPEVIEKATNLLQAKIVFKDGEEYSKLCEEYRTIWGDVLELVGLKKQ